MAVAHQEEQVIYELRHVARVSWKLETRKPSFSGLAWRGDGIWWDFMVIELDFAGFIHVIS